MQESFKKAYRQLNSEQKAAVDAIDGPVLVVAGPGTGKTQLLSVRVANILAKTDADAENIICLTFTNKAATNMRDRLFQLIGPASRNVTVRTFHSFAADIMNQYPDYFWEGAKLSIAPDAVQLEIIQSILAALPLDSPLASTFAGAFTALGDVQEGLKLAKEAGLTPAQLHDSISSNLKFIDTIEKMLVDILSTPLSFKKLDDLVDRIDALPEQIVPSESFLTPLSALIKHSLKNAVEADRGTQRTKNTGKWKLRWMQSISGVKAMHTERKRNNWWLSLTDVYESYRDQLHGRGYYDYSDMLIEVLDQLTENPDIRADVQERFQYVLIDEFQDTNAAQMKFAHHIADHYAVNNQPNLMAVGDDDQSIFAFNGAELNNMLEFRASYPTTRVIVLTENYRSNQAILDTAAQIIEQAEDRLVNRDPTLNKSLTSNVTDHRTSIIEHISYPTRQHQQTDLAKTIKKQFKTGGETIAVLARKHESLRQLANILLQRGVPVRYEQRSDVLQHEAVKQVLQLADLLIAVGDGDKNTVNNHLSHIIRHPMWGLKPRTLWQLATSNYSSNDWLDSLLTHEDGKLQIFAAWIVWLSRTSSTAPLRITIEHLLGLEESEYMRSPFRDYYLTQRSLSNSYLETLSAIELLTNLTNEFGTESATLEDFVRFVRLNLSTNRVIADETWFTSGKEAVNLMTVYRAKGLEFNSVYIVDAIEASWKPRVGGRVSPANLRLQSYGEKYDDYIRLLYVAATRAKTNLVATSYLSDDMGNELLPSPLLAPLHHRLADTKNIDTISVLEDDLHWPRLETKDEVALLAPKLEGFSLSPTAFIDFLNVAESGPSSFLERHLLRLPSARSAQGSYGTAVHAALETAQRLINTQTIRLEPIMDRFERALQSEHLAPLEYEQYFNRGEQLLKKLSGSNFSFVLKGGLAEQRLGEVMLGEAKLGGKVDRIDVDGAHLLISDYKTGKPLKSFDTKDKSKAIKAWRHRTQLIYYCLLARNSARFAKAGRISSQMIYLEAETLKEQYLQLEPEKDELERISRLIQVVWAKIQALDFTKSSQYPSTIEGIRSFEDALLTEYKKSPR